MIGSYLFSCRTRAGSLTFVLVVGAWQVPFVFGHRLGGRRRHLVRPGPRPIQVQRPDHSSADLSLGDAGLPAALVPVAVAYLFRPFRRTLDACRPQLVVPDDGSVRDLSQRVGFGPCARTLLHAALSVPGAAIGVVVERWAVGARGSDERRAWRWFLRGIGTAALAGAVVLGVATLFPWGRVGRCAAASSGSWRPFAWRPCRRPGYCGTTRPTSRRAISQRVARPRGVLRSAIESRPRFCC